MDWFLHDNGLRQEMVKDFYPKCDRIKENWEFGHIYWRNR